MRLIIAGVVLIATGVAVGIASAEHKVNYKVSRVSIQDVIVSCYNGGTPEVKKLGNMYILSCDGE